MRKLFAYAIVLLVIGVFILYMIATTDNGQVTNLISHLAEKQLGLQLEFAHYSTSRSKHFPYLSFEFEDIKVKGSKQDSIQQEVLGVKSLRFRIHPIDFFRSNYHLQGIEVDSSTLFFYRDEKGNQNTSFLKNIFNKKKKTSSKEGNIHFEEIALHHFFFDYTDDLYHKSYRTLIEKGNILYDPSALQPLIHFDADCLFKGLIFKQEHGPFLANQKAHLKTSVQVLKDRLQFLPSFLLIEEDSISLQGAMRLSKPQHLHLSIQSDGILLENARPLLHPQLQKTLNEFKVDQALKVACKIEGNLAPNQPLPVQVHFETVLPDTTQFKYQNVSIAKMNLKGSFQNNCHTKGNRIRPKDACLEIEQVQGILLHHHVIDLSGNIHDLKNLTAVSAKGTIEADLAQLSKIVGENSLPFQKGIAHLNFNYHGNPKRFLQTKELNEKEIDLLIGLKSVKWKNGTIPLEIPSGKLILDNGQLSLEKVRFKYQQTPSQVEGKVDQLFPYLFDDPAKLLVDLNLQIPYLHVDNFISSPSKNNIQQTWGTQVKELITPLQDQLAGQLHLNINELKAANFSLNDTEITLQLSKEEVNLSNWKSSFHQFTHLNGDSKISLMDSVQLSTNFKLKSTIANLQDWFKKDQLILNKGEINAQTDLRLNLDKVYSTNDLIQAIEYSSVIDVENASLQFLPQNIKIDDINSAIHLQNGHMQIDTLNLQVANTDFTIKGNLQNWEQLLQSSDTITHFDVSIYTPKLNQTFLEKFSDSTNTFQIASFFNKWSASLKQVDGKLDFRTDEMEFDPYFIQDFSSRIHLNEEQISIQKAKGLFEENAPFSVDAKINNYHQPNLQSTFLIDVPIPTLSRLLENDNFETKEGIVSFKVNYLNDLKDEYGFKDYFLKGMIAAQLYIKNTDLYYPARGFAFDEINCSMRLQQQNLVLDDLSLLLNQNKVYASGEISNFLPYFFEETDTFDIQLQLRSPHVNFKKFKTPRGLNQASIPQDSTTNPPVVNAIDRLLEDGKFTLNTEIDTISYVNFEAQNIQGKIQIDDQELLFENIAMDFANGHFGMNGEIKDIAIFRPKMNVAIQFDEVNTAQVLQSFDNFGQTGLTHENIKGTVKANIDFKAQFDDNYAVVSPSMRGIINFQTDEGEFINFGGFEKLGGFLFKKRQLHSIYFDTIQTTMRIDGLDVYFDRFEINSTAANFHVEGLYSFDKEENTRLLFEIPTGNIFTRYVNRKKIRELKKKRKGLPLLIEAFKEKDKLKFKWRLFK